MADLTPAQKIVAAFNDRHELCGPFDDDWVEQCLAAAFRAAADQVVPEEVTWQSPREELRHWPSRDERAGEQGMAWTVRRKLLAIATELEAQ